MRAPLDGWLLEVESHEATADGSRIDMARKNALAFSMSELEASACSPSEVAGFIEAAWQTYRTKLSRSSRSLWFYSWVDEQAGQLRCSATSCRSREDLPFGRAVEVTEDAELIAQQFLSASTLEGIKFSELRENTVGVPAAEPQSPPLNVFVRTIAP